MRRTDSLEKTLMLGKIEGRRRRGRQRMRWLDGITNSMGMSLISSRSWWWTGKPGVLQPVGSQSQTWLSDWTELNWIYVWAPACIHTHTYYPKRECSCDTFGASLVPQTVKNLPAMQENWVRYPGKGNGYTPIFLPGEFHNKLKWHKAKKQLHTIYVCVCVCVCMYIYIYIYMYIYLHISKNPFWVASG